MIFPKRLYYLDKQEAEIYSHRPGGRLNINRLIKNLAPWKKDYLQPALKNKKLIIADWTLLFSDTEKEAEKKALFRKLQENGFELYLWQAGEVKKMPSHPFLYFSQEEKKKITDEPVEAIKKVAMAEHHLAYDQVHVLTPQETNSLIEETGDEVRDQIMTSDLAKCIDIRNEWAIPEIIPLIHRLPVVVRDPTYDDRGYGFSHLKNLFKSIKSVETIERFSFNSTHGKEFYEERSLTINEKKIPLNDLKKVSSLKIWCDNTYFQAFGYTDLVTYCSQFKTLKFTAFNGLHTLPTEKNEQLENLRFEHGVEIKLSDLKAILNYGPNIKKLFFRNIKISRWFFTHHFGVDLEVLSFENVNDLDKDNDGLKNCASLLLKESPNLQKLTLINLWSLSREDFFSEDIHLSQLQEMTLSAGSKEFSSEEEEETKKSCPDNTREKINQLKEKDAIRYDLQLAQNAQKLLEKTEKLTYLFLSLPDIKEINLKKINLTQLHQLRLKGRFSITNLQQFLMSSRQLRVLEIEAEHDYWVSYRKRYFLEPFTETSFNLSELNYFSLKVGEISFFNLATIFNQAPQLKNVKITESMIESWNVNLTGLNALAYLELVECKMGVVTFEILLESAPHLKCLKLHAVGLGGYYEGKEFCLKDLEELEISAWQTAASVFEKMIEQSKKIKKVKLSQYNLYAFKRFLKKIKPEKLTHLVLQNHGPYCDRENLFFLKGAIHLTHLELTGFKNIFNDLQTNSLPHLTHLTLERCQLSQKELKKILLAAPNLESISFSQVRDEHSHVLNEITIGSETQPLLKKVKGIYGLKTKEALAAEKEQFSYHFSRQSFDEASLKENSYSHPISNDNASWRHPSSASSENHGASVGVSRSALEIHHSHRIEKIDADTHFDPNVSHIVKAYFFPLVAGTDSPSMSHYRLGVYDALKVNPYLCDPNNAFSIENQAAIDFILPDIARFESTESLLEKGKDKAEQDSHHHYFLGRKALSLTGAWQALPSCSAEEMITAYAYTPESAKLEIRYSKRDNLYYVKGEAGEKVGINFLLELPKEKAKPDLPTEVNELIRDFHQYGFHDLNMTHEEKPTGQDYLNQILKQRVGACRHRSIAFKKEMEKRFPEIPVRMITNDCHMFVEVCIQGEWIVCDLGGYPSKIEVDQSLNPDEKARCNYDEMNINEFFPHSKKKSDQSSDLKKEKGAKKNALHDEFHEEKLKNLSEESSFFKSIAKHEKALSEGLVEEAQDSSIEEFCQRLTEDKMKKRLIRFSSSQAVEGAALSLQSYCEQHHIPYFYIDTPDDLVCASPYLKREAERGEILPGPGGPFHDFLITHQNGIIIINYEHFDADDIVRFNKVIDKERFADKTPIPQEMTVLGLMNVNHPNAYLAADFTSRFDKMGSCLIETALADSLSSVFSFPEVVEKEAIEKSSKGTYCIDFFGSDDFEERLLGSDEIRGDHLAFIEGSLKHAIASGQCIEFKNAPLHNPKFHSFWRQARAKGRIDYANKTKTLVLPPALKCCYTQGYDWEALKKYLSFSTQAKGQILNPYYFNDFFRRYQVQNESMSVISGYIDAAVTEGHLSVYLTRSLSEGQWAELLTECQKKQVKLSVHCGKEVILPESLREIPVLEPVMPKTSADETTLNLALDSTRYIVSSDLEVSEASFSEYEIIDITECEPNDLLIHVEGRVTAAKKTASESEKALAMSMCFKQTQHYLLNALQADKKVLLKGHFSNEMVDALAPLLVERNQNPLAKGKLILLSSYPDFSYLKEEGHHMTVEDKQYLLQKEFSHSILARLEKEVLAEPLSRLRARLRYLKQHPNESCSEGAFQGFKALPAEIKLAPFNPVSSQAEAQAFHAQRLASVNQILEDSPYVFLTGLTGVGKTTFVSQYLKDRTLYRGLSQLKAWAESQEKKPTLFLDEANLSPTQWSQFEGLFTDPKGILIEGKYYRLSQEHQVIFAGNPVSYGDERHLAPFFERHGSALIFEPLPLSVIFEDIIKPVFEGANFPIEESARPFLKIYEYLCHLSTDRILISPRELEMMALLTLSYAKDFPEYGVEAAQFYAYELSKNWVPEAERETFEKWFKPQFTLARQPILTTSEFILTPSRLEMYQRLHEVLALRELRFEAKNTVQRFGGLGGIIIEGVPGIGKTELVRASLKAQGFEEVCDDKPTPEKPYYMLPASLDTEEKKRLLLKAFHEGAIVWIDEINSCPMLEAFLNALLMGKTPEGVLATKPGFMIIGTQNPATQAGRRLQSDALAHRFITEKLLPYSREEIVYLLERKGWDAYTSQIISIAFEKVVTKAIAENKPALTYRDLEKYLEREYSNAHSVSRAITSPLVNPTPKMTLAVPFKQHRPSAVSIEEELEKKQERKQKKQQKKERKKALLASKQQKEAIVQEQNSIENPHSLVNDSGMLTEKVIPTEVNSRISPLLSQFLQEAALQKLLDRQSVIQKRMQVCCNFQDPQANLAKLTALEALNQEVTEAKAGKRSLEQLNQTLVRYQKVLSAHTGFFAFPCMKGTSAQWVESLLEKSSHTIRS